ncbi:MAG: hypothetical protein ACR2HR_09775 [Euzebya sp.]
MPSQALIDWRGRLCGRLDELEAIHQSASGTGRGRRWGTEQLNGQLFVALVGQFQGFARGLHDETLDWLRVQGQVARVLADNAAIDRQLDKGNPHPGSLGNDFAKIGLRLSDEVGTRRWGKRRLHRLDRAVKLRNGVAHDDPSKIALAAAGPMTDRALPTLASYRTHREALDHLAEDIDEVVAAHLATLLGMALPW